MFSAIRSILSDILSDTTSNSLLYQKGRSTLYCQPPNQNWKCHCLVLDFGFFIFYNGLDFGVLDPFFTWASQLLTLKECVKTEMASLHSSIAEFLIAESYS